jgi:exonuclease SbcC
MTLPLASAHPAHPRIDRLAVRNFQSVESADLALGGFTVIVGPSNSGKSAVLRALKAVVRNVSSPAAVRVGKTAFTAQVTFGATDVSIERGKAQSTYRVSLPDETEEVFTKAGRTVPEEVQKIMGLPLPDGPDITFSTQIDPPFLLAETGTTTAKILGDLTNVSRLHAAAREANRRRLEASKLQKVRADDARACAVRLREEFSDLPGHAATLRESRDLLGSVQVKAREAERLSAVLAQVEVADAAESDLRARLAELPEPADITALADQVSGLLTQRRALLDVIDRLAQLAQAVPTLERESSAAAMLVGDIDSEYHDVLVQAGQCPTCGQAVAS